MARRTFNPRDFDYGVPEYDAIDEVEYEPVELQRATDALQVMGAAPQQNNPVIGRQVTLPVDPATGLLDITDASGWRDLVTAGFTGGTLWQVTLAPVTQQRANPAATVPFTGNPLLRMQFGGGGVSTELLFNYPLLGASFVLPAESITMAVRATDATVVIAPNGPPVVAAWLMRDAQPTYESSLFTAAFRNSPNAAGFVFPFAKRLHCAIDFGANPMTIEFFNFAGATIFRADIADTRYVAVPIPQDAQRYNVSTTAPASITVFQELAFT